MLWSTPPLHSLSRTAAESPGTSRATRMASEESCRRFRTSPSRTTPLPQMPMRCPPRTVKKPLRTRSSAVWVEA
ncbi:Uncharacterised protein [Flavonifractor plautii]|uniref:Uncharacterized protein n=1 Tax=Flavonifractor plautii TaxID=292800 RepID=A0A174SKC2_FLAPL|nr:Uncharacterised protein [Flavonifractor plautii]